MWDTERFNGRIETLETETSVNFCSSDHPKTSMIAAPIYYLALHFPAQCVHATRAKQETRASRDAEPERESRGA